MEHTSGDARLGDIQNHELDESVVDENSIADVYVTVRATEMLEDYTANLRAPILVSRGRGHQVINEAEYAPMRAPLFPATREKLTAA